MGELQFKDRREAGRSLAEALANYRGREELLVLGLPRGGVPVAAEVARSLNAPLDLMIVRKIGTPGQEELAMGAIASGGVEVFNRDLLEGLHLSQAAIDQVVERERKELHRREETYRGQRAPLDTKGRCVLLVDDGLATGATMRAAVQAVRKAGPVEVVVAVPVAPPDTVARLRQEADTVICLETPEPFGGVGRWYVEFEQTTDQEVADILARAWRMEEY